MRLTGIFLSYARVDAVKARTLASLLERAHHSVWWDRYIKGGTQYAHEIEAALRAADKVVVLWSAESVDSAWVRDEAAAGRDTGRLVPVTLDAAQPPLGFRQYQTVNFANWHGRGKPRNFQDLLDAIASTGGMSEGAENTAPSAAPPSWQRRLLWLIPLVVLVLGVSLYVARQPSNRSAAIVAVEPASNEANAVSAARDLSIRLSSLETANAGAFHLTEAKDTRPDLLLQVGVASGPTNSTRDVTLLSGPSRTILWAGHFQELGGKAGDLSTQTGVTTARVLSCAVEALSERKAKLNEQTVKLYLTGCSRLAEEYDETTSDVAPLLEKVVQSAPEFAPAWARLLYSEAIAVDGLPGSPMLGP